MERVHVSVNIPAEVGTGVDRGRKPYTAEECMSSALSISAGEVLSWSEEAHDKHDGIVIMERLKTDRALHRLNKFSN